MRVSVTHNIGALADDLAKIATETRPRMAGVVRRNVEQGNREAQRLARAASGPHGRLYWKRLSAEMTGVLTGEWGPHDGGIPIGAGYRHGPPNTDMAKSADIQGPKFANDVGDEIDKVFW